MTGGRDNDVVAVMPMAMVIERNLAVVPVMQTRPVFIDNHRVVMVMMMAVRPDDNVSLRRGCHGRRKHAKRQSAQDHFHVILQLFK